MRGSHSSQENCHRHCHRILPTCSILPFRHSIVVIIRAFDQRVPKGGSDPPIPACFRSQFTFEFYFLIGVNSYLERCVSAPPQDSQKDRSASGKKKSSPYGPYLLPLFHSFAAVPSFTTSSGANKEFLFHTRVLPSLVSFGASRRVFSIRCFQQGIYHFPENTSQNFSNEQGKFTHSELELPHWPRQVWCHSTD